MESLRVDGRRLWASIMEMGKIGATAGGGCGRLALTDLDRQARDLFVGWCEGSGLQVRVDRMGNIFARRPGRDGTRPAVLTGSHLDTQPLGGRFDGIYGVLAGLEVARTMVDNGITTEAPVEVAVWTDEEGVRFGAGMLASAAFSGLADVERARAVTDVDGVSVAEALSRIGYDGPEPVGGRPIDSFFEAHIEQGPILEAEGKTVGVVVGAQGQRCFQVTVDGEEGHAGTLPMTQRRDALLGAARMIDALNGVAFRFEPTPVITVGHIRVRPNSRNTIPGQALFLIDSRHPDNDTLAAIRDTMGEACREIAANAGLGVEVVEISARQAVSFDDDCIALIRQSAESLGIPHRDMFSAAGHDACNLARWAPTGMIFVPCEGGISHNERENATPEDLAAGADVLLRTMLARAGNGSVP